MSHMFFFNDRHSVAWFKKTIYSSEQFEFRERKQFSNIGLVRE